jgi:DNA repair exonuclease SbcCD ATPase subunit
LRSELQIINRQIDSTESQMLPETRRGIEEQLTHKLRLIEEHKKIKPEVVPQPTNELTEEQKRASIALAEIAEELENTKKQTDTNQNQLTSLAAKNKAGRNILEGIDVVNRSVQHFISSFSDDAELIGLNINEIIQVKANKQLITDIESDTLACEATLRSENQKLELRKEELVKKREPLNAKLNSPQKDYQNYLDKLKEWEEKKASILGNRDLPDTLKGLEHRKEQLDNLPDQRERLQAQRLEKSAEIFDLLNEQRTNRETLFQPVQKLIQNNSLIREEYKLQFKAELNSTTELITDKFFSLVKQASGEFRGESESLSVIKDLTDKHDLNSKQSLLDFLTELHDKLESSANGQVGIASMLRKGRTANEVYDFLFGLEYLKPRYTLMFQDAEIGQLSPGQRGSLLLIFYLLVDRGNSPIILDQPEENLDNETIVSLLVPVLNEAKQKRQIIMVTHNPNLAVVCDAEQIIHCEIDRKNGQKISYAPGAIECRAINRKVVDVLEGTMPAFDNRKIKYH